MDYNERKDMYVQHLAGRELIIEGIEAGNKGDGKTKKKITLHFPYHAAEHLIGEKSSWSAAKARVFNCLCSLGDGCGHMFGEFNPVHGRTLDCDLLVGNERACFGFRWDDKLDCYVVVSCLEMDMRNTCYLPWYKITKITKC